MDSSYELLTCLRTISIHFHKFVLPISFVIGVLSLISLIIGCFCNWLCLVGLESSFSDYLKALYFTNIAFDCLGMVSRVIDLFLSGGS